jgi:hypothetical protein
MTLPSNTFSAANRVVGAVSLVVVGHSSGAALLHGQAGLGAIEGLDLALFIDAEDQSLVRGIEVEPDDVLHLRGEVPIARNLESLDKMRLQSVSAPDPLNAAAGKSRRRRHAAHTPMGGIPRGLMQRHVHHLLDLLSRERLAARRPGCVLQQPAHPLAHVAAAPTADREDALAHRRRNRHRRQPVSRQQHDPGPPNHLLRRVAVPNQLLQSLTISCADRNPLDLPHPRRFAGSRGFVNRPSGTEH